MVLIFGFMFTPMVDFPDCVDGMTENVNGLLPRKTSSFIILSPEEQTIARGFQ
jgi:hypothetical protein